MEIEEGIRGMNVNGKKVKLKVFLKKKRKGILLQSVGVG